MRFCSFPRRAWLLLVIAVLPAHPSLAYASDPAASPAGSSASSTPGESTLPPSIWRHGIGQGFRRGALQSGFALGGGIGIKTAHFNRAHDLAIVSIHVGRALGANWEVLGELFGGTQLNPTPRSIVGFTPVIRYNFGTGTAWVPFVDGGVGLTYTSIRDDDLSTPLEFNLHLGAGTHFFLDEGRALTFQCRFLHLSNAYLKRPNRGANTLMIYGGMSWFF